MRRLGSLFSGYGGLDLAAETAFEAETVWHCDPDPAAGAVLARHWPHAPNLGDIEHVDWAAVEPVEVLTGGFPCQDLSLAGRRAGLRPGNRSGLWAAMARAIDVLRPETVVIENVRGILSSPAAAGELELCPWCVGDRPNRAVRALGAVLGDLADLGYDASWHGLAAADVGAPHQRYRVFIVATAHTARDGWHQGRPEPEGLIRGSDALVGGVPAAHTGRAGLEVRSLQPDRHQRPATQRSGARHLEWGPFEPAIRRWEQRLGRNAPEPTEPGRGGRPRLAPRFVEWLMGLPDGWVTDVPGLSRNDQLRLLGNGVVPHQALAVLDLLAPVATGNEQTAA